MRTALGVKQSALASESDTTQQNFSRTGLEEEVDDVMLERIAKTLGVMPDAIESWFI